MKSRDFCYWLQGLFELSDIKELDEKQTELIKKHLNMVFYHEIDPSMGGEEHQGKLSQIHHGDENLDAQALKQKLTAEFEQLEVKLLAEYEGSPKPTPTPTKGSPLRVPDYMNPDMTEEELDAKYGKGVKPRC